LLVGATIIISIDILLDVFALIYEKFYKELTWEEGYVSAFAIVVLMGYLGYYGVKASRILVPSYLMETNQTSLTIASSIVNIETHEVELLTINLNNSMVRDKAYLDENLTLSALANILSTSNKKLSYFINHHLNSTFYDYINHYRVNEMIAKMKSGKYEEYTLMGIAFESGFKSKTSFNRIFKKETGLSPSEFKKQL
jgi:AraC-like DNA-binding protein